MQCQNSAEIVDIMESHSGRMLFGLDHDALVQRVIGRNTLQEEKA